MKLFTADEEYQRNPNLRKSDIELLQEWNSKQRHLPKLTEIQTIWFLRSCNYRTELAKTTVDNYFTLKTHHADFFNALTENELKRVLKTHRFVASPKRTPQNHEVFISGLTDADASDFESTNSIRTQLYIFLLLLHMRGTSDGVIIVCDMKNSGFGHMIKMNLMSIKKMLAFLEQAAPFQLHAIHIVNMNPYTDKLFGLFKPLMSTDIADKLFFHANLERLHEHVPKECLPGEYGGDVTSDLSSLKDEYDRLLVENLPMLAELDKFKVDESKRPGKPRNINELFGIDGSFRQLSID